MMQLISKRTRAHMAVWVGCLVLAGCFNKDDNTAVQAPVTSNQPVLTNPLAGIPAGFVSNTFDLLRFQIALNVLAPSTSDTAEPFDVSGTTLPTSDSTEPFDA